MRQAVSRATLVAITVLAIAPLAVEAQVAPIAEQIAGAVLPLPMNQRASATVMGYRTAGELTVIREGSGDMICLADAPGNDTYHVACYHDSLEPFMAMGRALTARGIVDPEREELRAAAAEDGSLKMPEAPTAFHSLTAPQTAWAPSTGTLSGASRLHTVYVPWATAESTGLSTQPAGDGQPWLMFPGNYRAHIMVVPGTLPGG